jgi:hypothetical protein
MPFWLQKEMDGVMTIDIETEEFRKRWISRFDEQAKLSKKPAGHDPWEGHAAYRELSYTNKLWIVIPTAEVPDSPFHGWLTEKLAREVHFYRLFHKTIVPNNQCFKDTLDLLRATELKIKEAKTQKSSVKAELDGELEKCSSVLEKTRIAIERRRETYWKESLFAEPAERMTWMIEFDDDNQINSVPPEDLVQQERMFEKAKYPSRLVKRIDLDTRFQIRVAVILRSYLPHKIELSPIERSYLPQEREFSLKTISRLTLLTYLCGKLGNESDGELVVDGRKITVGGVDQKLRDAKLK